MQEIAAAVVFFAAAFAAMSVGLLLRGKPLQGSCGGAGDCGACGRKAGATCQREA